MRIGRPIGAKIAKKREDVFTQHDVHLRRSEVAEPGPAQILVGPVPGVLPLGEDPPFDRFFGGVGLVFGQGVQIVQTADKQHVGDLLDHLDRVGDATRPEGIPDAVNFAT